MEKNESPLLPIRQDELKQYKEEMTAFIKQASWKPDLRKRQNDQIDLGFLLQSKALGLNEADDLSLMKNAVRISDDRMLLTTSVAHVVNTIRDGLCIGRHVARLYEKASGLEGLLNRNRDGSMHQSEQPEFHEKMETQSAIQLFAASYFIVWRLKEYRAEEVSAINVEFGGVPEVKLQRPTRATHCMIYYYVAYLERSGVVNSELELIKLTELYFERMIEEIGMRKDSFKYAEPFNNNHYKLEGTEFIIQGFEANFGAVTASMNFNKIPMEAIVGNHEAKHMFRRYAERLLCHDLKTGRNPMMELGGLPSITMADGKPGTGKSMLIAATATILQERCEQIGLPFLFWPLPENIISTYQGGSAERALEWFKPMRDPNKIIFAPVDDAENNLEERTRQGVSAGVREFIGVFLRNTEGAYAINHGNRMISLFTNIPDQIDKAVLSRVQSRVSIDGAEVPHDFLDQDHIWWRKFEKVMPGFVSMKDPADYEYMTDQKPLRSLSEVYKGDYKFDQDGVREVYEDALKKGDPNSHEWFSEFYTLVLERYPFFSSRDLRNIQKAIDARIIDFDLPATWMDDPEEFFRKDYDTKLAMLRELMKSNLGGLSFADIRLREALFYIDTAVRINTTGIEREIQQTAKRMHVTREANERLAKGEISVEG